MKSAPAVGPAAPAPAAITTSLLLPFPAQADVSASILTPQAGLHLPGARAANIGLVKSHFVCNKRRSGSCHGGLPLLAIRPLSPGLPFLPVALELSSLMLTEADTAPTFTGLPQGSEHQLQALLLEPAWPEPDPNAVLGFLAARREAMA